jgi:SAM-dependent methyltransferase
MTGPCDFITEISSITLSKMVNLPSGYTDIYSYAKDLIAFLHEPLPIQITGGIHVNDAFIYNAWQNLPQDWTQWWSSLPTPQHAQKDLINSLRNTPEARLDDLPDRPASLSQWLSRIRHLSLNREQLILPDSIPHVQIPEVLAQKMLTKKLAEVKAGARYISYICKLHRITRVVDVGSGQGYLSLTLAATCGLKVLAIDGSASQIQGSRAAATKAGLVENGDVTHLVRYVTGIDELGEVISKWAEGERCLLTGLHACGSLSEHMIRLSTTVPEISYIAVVGCCFNHIQPLSPSHPNGFPISKTIRNGKLILSASALVTGCQAPTNWPPQPANSVFGKKAFYRAVLEKLLWDKKLLSQGTQQQQRPVWGIRTGDLSSFPSYTSRALSSLHLSLGTDITEAEIKEYEQRYEARKGEIAILQTLSVLLCRVVESVIALDRVFYLREQGMEEVDVVPVFEYRESPRNLMVVGRKW